MKKREREKINFKTVYNKKKAGYFEAEFICDDGNREPSYSEKKSIHIKIRKIKNSRLSKSNDGVVATTHKFY